MYYASINQGGRPRRRPTGRSILAELRSPPPPGPARRLNLDFRSSDDYREPRPEISTPHTARGIRLRGVLRDHASGRFPAGRERLRADSEATRQPPLAGPKRHRHRGPYADDSLEGGRNPGHAATLDRIIKEGTVRVIVSVPPQEQSSSRAQNTLAPFSLSFLLVALKQHKNAPLDKIYQWVTARVALGKPRPTDGNSARSSAAATISPMVLEISHSTPSAGCTASPGLSARDGPLDAPGAPPAS